ncbi:MAG: penicillin acylase family protein, partial [Calditrichaeota bacterium]
MQKGTKIILAVLFFLIVMSGTIAVLSYILINKSLPQYNGKIDFPALSTPAEIQWNEFAVPHIQAKDDADLFRLLGYVHAQERLWQMDFFRRAGAGELSEIFGAEALSTDKLMRTWGLKSIAQTALDSLSNESRTVLTAYSEGVNHFMKTNTARLPIEFSLLGYKPRPWEPIDTITIQKVVAMRLSQAWHVELTFYQLAQKFGLRAAMDLFPDYPAATGG